MVLQMELCLASSSKKPMPYRCSARPARCALTSAPRLLGIALGRDHRVQRAGCIGGLSGSPARGFFGTADASSFGAKLSEYNGICDGANNGASLGTALGAALSTTGGAQQTELVGANRRHNWLCQRHDIGTHNARRECRRIGWSPDCAALVQHCTSRSMHAAAPSVVVDPA